MTEPIAFTPWPKTPRIFKDPMVITEKIDGTNAAVGVLAGDDAAMTTGRGCQFQLDGQTYLVYAQSRNRLIAPEDDNYGFARWVWSNGPDLARVLGPGVHFGEWWGQGIARKYGLDHKRFSLFNTHRWGWLAEPEARAEHSVPEQLHVVPTLATHTLDTAVINSTLTLLGATGSEAAPGFMNPEGICVYFAGQSFKYTFDGDLPKSARG